MKRKIVARGRMQTDTALVRIGPPARILVCGCALALAGTALAGGPGLDETGRKRIAQGPKLRLAAAAYFGGAGAERFAGIVCRPDGEAIAYGNSWGPPFPPATVEPVVLGADAARRLPLFHAGAPGGDAGCHTLPSAHHPDRTGFLVRYAADLRTVGGVTRFGWGAATVDAAVLAPDGGLVTAGMAREGFASAAGGARVSRLPAGTGPRYGADAYQDVVMPGDVYVARWRDDLKGFAWVWILEKHVDPPPRLFAAPDGAVVFDCAGVKRIGAAGDKLDAAPVPSGDPGTEDRFLAGVSPRSGALLFAGWTLSRSGAREWLGPLVEERGADGRGFARYYDWRAALACQPTLSLAGAAGVTQADYLPDGHIAIGAPVWLGRSVLERNPVDITLPAGTRGVLAGELVEHANRSVHAGAVRYNLARFDPARPSDSAWQFWTGVAAPKSAGSDELTLDGLRALDANRIAVWGMSGGALLETHGVAGVGANAAIVAKWRTKPLTPYLTVFSRDFADVLWSSLLPRCAVSGAAAGPRGVLVAAACRAPAKVELYEALSAPGAQDAFGGGYMDGQVMLLEPVK